MLGYRNYVMVNSDVWSGTSDANKNVIRGCATLAEYAGTWRSKEYTEFTMQGLRDGGMTVEKANPTMKGELQEIGATMLLQNGLKLLEQKAKLLLMHSQ